MYLYVGYMLTLPFCARHLRRLARQATELKTDTTDYHRSWTARAFVPYYAQRMSSAVVMMDARGILKGIDAARRARLRGSDTVPA